MNATQRKNLLQLAAYLETLPRNYQHFNMLDYAQHDGDCVLPMSPFTWAAIEPAAFLANCGTAACAVGHGPAAGIKPKPGELLSSEEGFGTFVWDRYVARSFGTPNDGGRPFDFLFGSNWVNIDNHHYGAAARIRYLLAGGEAEYPNTSLLKKYAPYRKGSRSATRREIEAA